MPKRGLAHSRNAINCLGPPKAFVEGPLSPAFLTLQLPSCTHTYLSLPYSAVPSCTRRNAHIHTVPPPLCNLADQGSQRAHQVLNDPKMETEAPPGEELVQDLKQQSRLQLMYICLQNLRFTNGETEAQTGK